MKDVLQECVALFDDPGWSIVVAIERDLPPVWGDRSLLVQALVNLITAVSAIAWGNGANPQTVALADMTSPARPNSPAVLGDPSPSERRAIR